MAAAICAKQVWAAGRVDWTLAFVGRWPLREGVETIIFQSSRERWRKGEGVIRGAQTAVTRSWARLFGSRNASGAAINRPAPRAAKGTVMPWYSVLSQPTIQGPAKPPMLPRALTRPITGPKTARGRVSVGMAQKGGMALT